MPIRHLVVGDTTSTVFMYRQLACFMQTLDWRVSNSDPPERRKPARAAVLCLRDVDTDGGTSFSPSI